MSAINEHLFNANASESAGSSIFFGETTGLFDTIDRHYPEIDEIFENMRSLDWSENEFDYSSCLTDFEQCPKSVYDMMIKTLAWQWEADSLAARSIIGVLAPVISNDSVSRAWLRISDNENTHAGTYSEIVRNSFRDPTVIKTEIAEIQESLGRLETVGKVMSDAYEVSHKYALGMLEVDQEVYNKIFMFVVALYALERIQFMASFAVTFTIANTGMFQPIGKAVQKIAQDELEVHVEMDKAVLRREMQTERGRIAFEQCKSLIKQLLDEVVHTEEKWLEYLFSEGRELVGSNLRLKTRWMHFMALDPYSFFGIEPPFEPVLTNPLKLMDNWLDISKIQASAQEEDLGAYRVNIMRRTDEDEEFEVDF